MKSKKKNTKEHQNLEIAHRGHIMTILQDICVTRSNLIKFKSVTAYLLLIISHIQVFSICANVAFVYSLNQSEFLTRVLKWISLFTTLGHQNDLSNLKNTTINFLFAACVIIWASLHVAFLTLLTMSLFKIKSKSKNLLTKISAFSSFFYIYVVSLPLHVTLSQYIRDNTTSQSGLFSFLIILNIIETITLIWLLTITSDFIGALSIRNRAYEIFHNLKKYVIVSFLVNVEDTENKKWLLLVLCALATLISCYFFLKNQYYNHVKSNMIISVILLLSFTFSTCSLIFSLSNLQIPHDSLLVFYPFFFMSSCFVLKAAYIVFFIPDLKRFREVALYLMTPDLGLKAFVQIRAILKEAMMYIDPDERTRTELIGKSLLNMLSETLMVSSDLTNKEKKKIKSLMEDGKAPFDTQIHEMLHFYLIALFNRYPKNSQIALTILGHILNRRENCNFYELISLYDLCILLKKSYGNAFLLSGIDTVVLTILRQKTQINDDMFKLMRAIEVEDQFQQFFDLIIKEASMHTQYWSYMRDFDIPAKKLQSLAIEIEENYRNVLRIWDGLQSRSWYLGIHFYVIYGLYLTIVRNNSSLGAKELNKAAMIETEDMKLIEQNILRFHRNNIFSNRNALLNVSCSKSTLGMILECSAGCKEVFGNTNEYLVGKKIGMLMIPTIAQLHDNYIDRYLETGKESIFYKNNRFFGIDSRGFAIPLLINVQINPFSKEGFTLLALIKRLNFEGDFIILTNSGKIDACTENFKRRVYLPSLHGAGQVDIHAVCPNFAKSLNNQFKDLIRREDKYLHNDILKGIMETQSESVKDIHKFIATNVLQFDFYPIENEKNFKNEIFFQADCTLKVENYSIGSILIMILNSFVIKRIGIVRNQSKINSVLGSKIFQAEDIVRLQRQVKKKLSRTKTTKPNLMALLTVAEPTSYNGLSPRGSRQTLDIPSSSQFPEETISSQMSVDQVEFHFMGENTRTPLIRIQPKKGPIALDDDLVIDSQEALISEKSGSNDTEEERQQAEEERAQEKWGGSSQASRISQTTKKINKSIAKALLEPFSPFSVSILAAGLAIIVVMTVPILILLLLQTKYSADKILSNAELFQLTSERTNLLLEVIRKVRIAQMFEEDLFGKDRHLALGIQDYREFLFESLYSDSKMLTIYNNMFRSNLSDIPYRYSSSMYLKNIRVQDSERSFPGLFDGILYRNSFDLLDDFSYAAKQLGYFAPENFSETQIKDINFILNNSVNDLLVQLESVESLIDSYSNYLLDLNFNLSVFLLDSVVVFGIVVMAVAIIYNTIVYRKDAYIFLEAFLKTPQTEVEKRYNKVSKFFMKTSRLKREQLGPRMVEIRGEGKSQIFEQFTNKNKRHEKKKNLNTSGFLVFVIRDLLVILAVLGLFATLLAIFNYLDYEFRSSCVNQNRKIIFSIEDTRNMEESLAILYQAVDTNFQSTFMNTDIKTIGLDKAQLIIDTGTFGNMYSNSKGEIERAYVDILRGNICPYSDQMYLSYCDNLTELNSGGLIGLRSFLGSSINSLQQTYDISNRTFEAKVDILNKDIYLKLERVFFTMIMPTIKQFQSVLNAELNDLLSEELDIRTIMTGVSLFMFVLVPILVWFLIVSKIRMRYNSLKIILRPSPADILAANKILMRNLIKMSPINLGESIRRHYG